MSDSAEFPWDQFKGGDFPDRFKFEQPGQSIVGTITNIRVTDFGSGKPEDRTPELWIKPDDSDEVSVLASQARLRVALAEQRPRVGDRIAIVYTGDGQAKPPKSAPKLFDVKVVRAGENGQPAAAPAAEGTPAAEQEPVAAASGKTAADLI